MTRHVYLALVLSLFVPFGPVRAQLGGVAGEVQEDGKKEKEKEKTPGDKKDGEEKEIRRRKEWFRKMRQLDEVDRPAERRKQAVEDLKTSLYLQPSTLAVSSSWSPLGPSPMNMMSWSMGRVAGRVSALAVSPSNESILYLGTASGGVWKSYDGGSFWYSMFDNVGTETVGSVAIDPNNENVLWVGTGEQGQDCYDYFGMGLFRSIDGALSWEERSGTGSQTLNVSNVTAAAVQPGNSNLVLAGGPGDCSGGFQSSTTAGVYRTTDAGVTWTRVLGGTSVNDILFDPLVPNTVYAALSDRGVYKSTDGGATWALLSNGLPTGFSVVRVRLAMAPTNRNILYALVSSSYTAAKLYRSLDGGASWTLRNSSACDGQCSYNLSLSVSPASSDTVLVGTIRLFRSTNGGSTLSAITSSWGSSQKVHQDTHVVQYSRTNGSKYWVGSDGGLWRTTDNGSNYTNLNSNLNITQFYDVAVHPDNSSRIFGGAQDNSSSGRSASSIWDVTVVTGDGFVNAVDPGNTNYVFTESYPTPPAEDNTGPNIYRSTNGGGVSSFSALSKVGIDLGEDYFPWKTEYVVMQSTTSSYLVTGSTYLYRVNARSSSFLFNWSTISGDIGGVVSALGPAAGGGLYVGTQSGKVLLSNSTLVSSPTWMDRTGDLPYGTISDIAVDPNDRWRVFVTRSVFGGSKLYRSTAGGNTWTAVGNGLPDVPANTVAVDPVNRQRIFVGTDIGVFVSEDGGDNFEPQMIGLPLGVVVTDLEVDDSPHVLTAATYGRGAWQLPLPSEAASCVPAGGVDDTLYKTSCCSWFAVNGTTVCNDPNDFGTDWVTCNQICGSEPDPSGCIPPGGIDDLLSQTHCCTGLHVTGSEWCLDPADFGTDWTSCVQICS